MLGYLIAVLLSLIPTFDCATALGPAPGQIKNLVTFGDSYTDIEAAILNNATSWPVYAADYGKFKLFPFAKSGATCSNNLTFRPSPSVFESQIPAFVQSLANGSLGNLPHEMEETVFTLWIGTNDVGVNALLTGSQTPGVTIVNVTECAVNWITMLYHEVGARNFVLQNMIPLQDVILYSQDSYPNRYWTEQRNTTEWSLFMDELTMAGNQLSLLMVRTLPLELPGAHIGYFDSHTLFSDILASPQDWLNGTAPLNITGAEISCIFKLNEAITDVGDCTIATGTDRDSFVWFDELHPSEQSARNVARQITNAITRVSDRFMTWVS